MKKLLFSIFTLGILLTSCQKEDIIMLNDSEVYAQNFEQRGLSLGFGFQWAWLDQKFKLSTDGLKKVTKLEKKYGKKDSRVKALMTTKDFEYFVHNAERRNPGNCPTTKNGAKDTAWKKTDPNICYLPSWCPDYTKAINY